MALMNAPYLLREIVSALKDLATNGLQRTIRLSQFPLSDEDGEAIRRVLGEGRTVIQVRGPSPAVWRESRFAGVWWGEYYDGNSRVALRTIEIALIPELAPAPLEDVADGLRNLETSIEEIHADA